MKVSSIIVVLSLLMNIIFISELIVGNNITILRQLLGFIYLTFIPGLILLLLLKININNPNLVLYSIGLSLVFVMSVGAIMNTLTIFGLKPISEIPLFITISLLIFIMIILLHRFNDIEFNLHGRKIISNEFLAFSILPFISVSGAYFLNYYTYNIVLIVLYIIVSFIPILVTLDKIPDKLYPYVVWTVSISLLFSVALSVRNLSGHLSDATLEYYFANLVKTNGFWDSTISRNKNAMLTIVFVHPIYSILLNLDLRDVFKVVYPILYSPTPVALYYTYYKFFDKRLSFYACYWFMVFYVFYVVLSRNTRTGFAELFLALFLLTLVDDRIDEMKKRILMLIFALAIVLSHYGVAYILLFTLMFSCILLLILSKIPINMNNNLNNINYINVNFVLVYIIFTFGWYIYTTTSSCFDTLISFARDVTEKTMYMLISPETSYTLYAVSRKWVLSVEISKYIYALSIIFISMGILSLILNIVKKRKINVQINYIILSISIYIILVAGLIVTKSFNPSRVYHISLCFLSPFVVIGFNKLLNLFKCNKKIVNLILSGYLMFSLLISSGVIAETITKSYGDYAPNVILSKPRYLEINDTQYLKSFYLTYLFDEEVYSAEWLYRMKAEETKIYMDIGTLGAGLFIDLMGPNNIAKCYVYVKNSTDIKKGYIYLSTLNVQRHVALVKLNPPTIVNITQVFSMKGWNKIYTNGNSIIYLK